MRFLFPLALMLCLTACGDTQSSPDAVRDQTRPLRRELAVAALGEDLIEIRRTTERLLSALACGWREPACPTNALPAH